MKKNKGYTLIEMIIVIAIMAILTGVAAVTIGIIKEAKCDAAINTFQNQLDSLWIKTKSISQATVQATPTDASNPQSQYPLGMRILLNTDENDDVRDGSYQLILGFEDGATFEEKEVVSTMPEFISIKYTPQAASTSTESQSHGTLTVLDEEGTVGSTFIQFNKSTGAVKYGAGTYDFVYNGRIVGSVYLDPVTGKHYIK